MSNRHLQAWVLRCSLALLLLPAAARPEIVVGGDAAFKKAVEDCMQSFAEADPETAALIKQLKDSKNKINIDPSEKSNGTTANSDDDANSKAAGGTGKGSGSKVTWDPKYTDAYQDGTKRDPCASLLHELAHAANNDAGTRDMGNDPATGISKSEINSCKEENRYRKKTGKPQRGKYDDKALPANAKF